MFIALRSTHLGEVWYRARLPHSEWNALMLEDFSNSYSLPESVQSKNPFYCAYTSSILLCKKDELLFLVSLAFDLGMLSQVQSIGNSF